MHPPRERLIVGWISELHLPYRHGILPFRLPLRLLDSCDKSAGSARKLPSTFETIRRYLPNRLSVLSVPSPRAPTCIGPAHQPRPEARVKIMDFIWIEKFVQKIEEKHNLDPSEVEDVLTSSPHIRLAERGKVKGEDVYAAFGQAESGRYLVIFFINKGRGQVLPISARDMTESERSYFNDQAEAD